MGQAWRPGRHPSAQQDGGTQPHLVPLLAQEPPWKAPHSSPSENSIPMTPRGHFGPQKTKSGSRQISQVALRLRARVPREGWALAGTGLGHLLRLPLGFRVSHGPLCTGLEPPPDGGLVCGARPQLPSGQRPGHWCLMGAPPRALFSLWWEEGPRPPGVRLSRSSRPSRDPSG